MSEQTKIAGPLAPGYGSTYLVWFASIALPQPGQEGLISRRVESATFVAVEDWAHENTPEGYELSEITKSYGDTLRLNTYAGPVEVNLRETPQAVSGVIRAGDGGSAIRRALSKGRAHTIDAEGRTRDAYTGEELEL